MLGSIGVVAGMPNVHKLLKKNDVEYLMFTAGKFKRTVTALTENTEVRSHDR
jgi:serine protease SohB